MATVDPFAQAVMTAYCGWDPTNPVTETVVLDGNGTAFAFLPSLYVTDVSAVVVTDNLGAANVLVVGQSGDVQWSDNGSLQLNSCQYGYAWPEGLGNVAVTYSGGYATTPDDLDAVLASLSNRMGTLGGGIASRRLGTAQVTYSGAATGDLLLVEKMVLDRYRIPKVR